MISRETLRCIIFSHDYELDDPLADEEYDEPVAVHYRSKLQNKYVCQRCGKTERLGTLMASSSAPEEQPNE